MLPIKTSQASNAADDTNGIGVLLDLAETALRDRRLVAPKGSNVYERDLSALQLDPHNKKALDNLHASFEPACHNVEEAIAKSALDEAERELHLLRDYGAKQHVQKASYKVSLLGSYLYAQRTVLIRKHEAEAFEMQGGKPSGGANVSTGWVSRKRRKLIDEKFAARGAISNAKRSRVFNTEISLWKR
jgi:protein TonB